MRFEHRKQAWWISICAFAVAAGVLLPPARAGTSGRAAGELEFEGSTFSKLSPAEKALLAEYRKNYVRLRDFYHNVTMEARQEFFAVPRPAGGIVPPGPDAGLKFERAKTYVFRTNGGNYYRLDVAVSDDADASRTKGLRTGIVTPSESFLLGRNSLEGVYFLVAHGDKNEGLSELSGSWFHRAPFAHAPVELEHLLFKVRKEYTIESITVDSQDGKEVVSLSLLFENPKGWARTVFRFDRGRSWALMDARHTSPSKRGSDGLVFRDQRCVYGGDSDGVPLLQECSMEDGYEISPGGPKRVMQREVVRIDKITPGAPPLSEFDAKALIGTVGRKTSRPYLKIVLATIGVVLLVAGFLLRRHRRAV